MSTALPLSASVPRPASVALSRLAPHIIVIGAGVGGLAVAVRLLSQGYRVTVLERGATAGGKMRQVRVGNHVFDGGPSVMTMPAVLQRLCASASVRQEDLIPLEPLEQRIAPRSHVIPRAETFGFELQVPVKAIVVLQSAVAATWCAIVQWQVVKEPARESTSPAVFDGDETRRRRRKRKGRLTKAFQFF